MNWNDVAAALRAGASPEELLTKPRTGVSTRARASRSGGDGDGDGDGGGGVDGLYRSGMGRPLQLCYLHTPLHVLELLDGCSSGSAISRSEHFDGELSFDLLDMFSPRLVRTVPEASLSLLSRARPCGTKKSRRRKALRTEGADAASIYASYKVDGMSDSEAALCALRDVPNSTLASYIAVEVLPNLPAREQGKVGVACRHAAGGVGRLSSEAVRAAVEKQVDALQAVKVLDALLGSGGG